MSTERNKPARRAHEEGGGREAHDWLRRVVMLPYTTGKHRFHWSCCGGGLGSRDTKFRVLVKRSVMAWQKPSRGKPGIRWSGSATCGAALTPVVVVCSWESVRSGMECVSSYSKSQQSERSEEQAQADGGDRRRKMYNRP
ncbi:hypothetical protein B0F90DRAFT_1671545 [Multifurca ochricompacta]|uniref:Uncharacterized protein n=1 Tax=Multifurca ochricompacta TaxID=376703 RepID=A0AAD4LUQ3_9AGAM|nr:hypothetical protein B0F90DRAFT_1671545 [Multifurca ochricompacta]